MWLAPGVRIGYVSQEPALDTAQTVYEAVASGLSDLRQLLIDYHHAIAGLTGQAAEANSMQRIEALQHELEMRDGWQLNRRIESVLNHLALAPDAKVEQLSGGWRKRTALAQALVAQPDLLLLDEPTNHLDLPAIEWLESFLLDFPGTVLLVTHDRRFLDRITTRIVELDRGRCKNFPESSAPIDAAKKHSSKHKPCGSKSSTSCSRKKRCGFVRA